MIMFVIELHILNEEEDEDSLNNVNDDSECLHLDSREKRGWGGTEERICRREIESIEKERKMQCF